MLNGIESFEVYPSDLKGQYNWEDAKSACDKLGEGWRLPTKPELNDMYQRRDEIGGFIDNYYWSSTEDVNRYVMFQDFDGGRELNVNKNGTYYVRPVRNTK